MCASNTSKNIDLYLEKAIDILDNTGFLKILEWASEVWIHHHQITIQGWKSLQQYQKKAHREIYPTTSVRTPMPNNKPIYCGRHAALQSILQYCNYYYNNFINNAKTKTFFFSKTTTFKNDYRTLPVTTIKAIKICLAREQQFLISRPAGFVGHGPRLRPWP